MKKHIFRALTATFLAVVLIFSASCRKKNNDNQGNGGDTVTAPTINNFSVAADTGSVAGKVNEDYVVSYTITGDCTGETISAQKGGADTTDFSYNAQTKKIKFTASGAYTVKLTAMNGTKGTSDTADLTIADWQTPVITTTVPASGTVNTGVSIVPAATYETGDSAGTSKVEISYSQTQDGTFAAITADNGTFASNTFTPKATGYFKIKVSVTSAKNISASQTFSFQAMSEGAVVLDHEYPSNAAIEAKTGTAKILNYTATGGNPADYTASVVSSPSATVSADTSAKTVSFTAATAGDYTVTLSYTHNSDSNKNASLTFSLKAKANLNAPTFGTDPFNGMASSIRPNAGLLIYYDVTDDDTTITEDHITYSVTNLTGSSGQVSMVNNQKKYRYFHGTVGTYELKMTVKDDSGNSAEATKTITVDSSIDYATMGNTVYTGSNALGFNLDNYNRVDVCDSEVVMAKNGFISNRSNTTTEKAIALLGCADLGANFEVILKIDVIVSGSSLLAGVWTGAVGGDTPAGNMWFDWSADGAGVNGSDLTGANNLTPAAPPAMTNGSSFYIRYKREVVGTNATLSVSYSLNGTTFTTVTTAAAAESAVAGNGGAPVINLALWHNVGGTYMISGATFRSL